MELENDPLSGKLFVHSLKWTGTGQIRRPLYQTYKQAYLRCAEENAKLNWYQRLMNVRWVVVTMEVEQE